MKLSRCLSLSCLSLLCLSIFSLLLDSRCAKLFYFTSFLLLLLFAHVFIPLALSIIPSSPPVSSTVSHSRFSSLFVPLTLWFWVLIRRSLYEEHCDSIRERASACKRPRSLPCSHGPGNRSGPRHGAIPRCSLVRKQQLAPAQ